MKPRVLWGVHSNPKMRKWRQGRLRYVQGHSSHLFEPGFKVELQSSALTGFI